MQIAPMLATAAEPFDSAEHLFEIKWDGIRALAAIERGGPRLWGRGADDYTNRYVELEVLRQLPVGTVLDGELVRLDQQGRADFPAVLRRHQLSSPRKIRTAARCQPVTYVVFDLLQLRSRLLTQQPLQLRRQLLEELLPQLDGPHCCLSPAVVGGGESFFRQVAGAGHEGVMAKRLDSTYQAGRRSPAWRKIKPRDEALCAVFGYRRRRGGSPSALLLAAQNEQRLCYAGEVSCRLTQPTASELAEQLAERAASQPLVPCRKRAHWVRPEILCRVRHFGRTGRGRLRFPSLLALLTGEDSPPSGAAAARWIAEG